MTSSRSSRNHTRRKRISVQGDDKNRPSVEVTTTVAEVATRSEFHEELLDEESPRIQKLLDIGRQKGCVDVDDILTVFPDAEQDISQLDDAHAALMAAGIEVVEKSNGLPQTEDEEELLEEEKARIKIKIKRRRKSGKSDESGLETVDVDDTIGLYLKEVGGVPLLTKEQEVWLAKRMEKAVFARETLSKSVRVDRRKRSKLDAIVEDGMTAREHLVTANSRLVISVAKKYIGRGVPFLDLIQEGNIGLLRATKKFDYHRGHKFSTYATWWIRQAVTRAIADQGRTIRVPVHMGDQINKLLRASHELTQRLGRDPVTEELAEALEVPPKKIEDMIQIARRPLSLEMPTDNEEDTMLGDFVEDEDSPAPVELATQNLLREQLSDALARLPPREVRILQLRYGLLDGESYTLEEVGKKMGVTRERVRQIEAQALSRLRHPEHRRRLDGYLKDD